MTRPIAAVVAVVMLSGCRGGTATTAVDPFLGRTRVEPPRTGSAAGQPPANSYAPAAQPQSAPGWGGSDTTQPAGAGGAVDRRYEPPGGTYDYKGTSVRRSPTVALAEAGDVISIPSAARELPDRQGTVVSRDQEASAPTKAEDDGRISAGRGSVASDGLATVGSSAAPARRSTLAATDNRAGNSLAGRERIIRTIEPRPTEPADSRHAGSTAGTPGSSRREPRRLVIPDGAIDIMDLPAAGTSNRSRPPPGPNGIRLVSGTEGSDGPAGGRGSSTISGGKSESFSPRARYGHDPNYGWLRGRLEYSQGDQRWKLRYIPIDGVTDDFGGSVVLSDESLLSGYERGEFVEVRGKLGAVAPDTHGFAPDYEVRQIKRLSE